MAAGSSSSSSSSSSSNATWSNSSSSYNTPCAACKFLRRKCMGGCIFAPYFPPEEPHKFANVHKIFGASNVTKLLNDLLPHQREDAVNSLAYEAEARVRDPVYGCVGAISFLQRQVHRLQKELDAANADLMRFNADLLPPPPPPTVVFDPLVINPRRTITSNINQAPGGTGRGGGGGGGFYGGLPSFPYGVLPWDDDNSNGQGGGGRGSM